MDINDEDYIDSCQKQSDLILDEIRKAASEKHNYLIVPMRVYNIFQFSSDFDSVPHDASVLVLVGHICGFHVYLDMYMSADEIVVSYDKSISRDSKLDYILNDIDVIKEKRVKIS